jgi:hypothetical protein
VIRIFCSWRIEEQAENARQMSQRARQTVSRVSHDHGLFSSDMDQVLERLGGRTRARTWDPMIKSHLLYQLSYAPGSCPEKPCKRASFSKATPRCPASRSEFSRPLASPRNGKKPLEFSGFRRHRVRPAETYA